MSNNDIILCRSFGDEPLVRIVWSITKKGILISTQESFHLWEKTNVDPVVVLAPFDAIYQYDKDLFHQLEEAFRTPGNQKVRLKELWRQAKPYEVIQKDGLASGLQRYVSEKRDKQGGLMEDSEEQRCGSPMELRAP